MNTRKQLQSEALSPSAKPKRYNVENTPAGFMVYDDKLLKYANSYAFPSEHAAIQLCDAWNKQEDEKRERAARLAAQSNGRAA